MHGVNGVSEMIGLVWILGIVLLVILVWVVSRVLRPTQSSSLQKNQPSIDLLRERFIKGEIDKDEYLEKKKLIE